MHETSLIYFKLLNDPYCSCWVMPLFGAYKPFPTKGLTVSRRPIEIEWEEIWNNFHGIESANSNADDIVQMIYSGVFVSGRNCEYRSENIVPELGEEILLSDERICVDLTRRQFEVQWLLEGCLGLPQFSAILNDLLKLQWPESKICEIASNVFPLTNARLGFKRGNELGSLKILRELGERRYLVETLSVSSGMSNSPILVTSYVSSQLMKSRPKSVEFALEL